MCFIIGDPVPTEEAFARTKPLRPPKSEDNYDMSSAVSPRRGAKFSRFLCLKLAPTSLSRHLLDYRN